MKEEDFKQLIRHYVCPLLAGSVLTPESQPVANGHAHELAALTGNGQTMHISAAKKAPYKVEIKRNQKFTGDDVKLVKAIVAQLVEHYGKTPSPYQERIIGYAIEVGICHFLSAHNGTLLVNILDAFEGWSARTYEGRKPTFTIVVQKGRNQAMQETHPLITAFLDHDFFAPLSNGVNSGVLVSAQGALLEYVDFAINSTDANTFAPARFISVANCADEHKLCLTLTNNGEVLIFKDQKLLFSKLCLNCMGRFVGVNEFPKRRKIPRTSCRAQPRHLACSSNPVNRVYYCTQDVSAVLDMTFFRIRGRAEAICLYSLPSVLTLRPKPVVKRWTAAPPLTAPVETATRWPAAVATSSPTPPA